MWSAALKTGVDIDQDGADSLSGLLNEFTVCSNAPDISSNQQTDEELNANSVAVLRSFAYTD